jgi:uncharacterized membrane protein YidH (DUF202 family)
VTDDRAPARQLFDVGLQPERTALAWERTAVALGAASIAATRILPQVLGTWAVLPAGFGVATSVAVFALARRRYRAAHQLLTGSNTDRLPLPSGVLPFMTAALVFMGGAAALAVVLIG